jgi:hypothetical protein
MAVLHAALDQDPLRERDMFNPDRQVQRSLRGKWLMEFNRQHSSDITGTQFGQVLRDRKEAREKGSD